MNEPHSIHLPPPPAPPVGISSGVTELVRQHATPGRKAIHGNSPSSKASLGIPEDHNIIWIPFNVDPAWDKLIHAVAGVRDIKKTELLKTILWGALGAQVVELQAEAIRYVPSTSRRVSGRTVVRTPEEAKEKLAAEVTRRERSLAKAKEMLEKLGGDGR